MTDERGDFRAWLTGGSLSSRLIGGGFVSMSVRAAGMVIAFLSHILLSRTLGPQAYGNYVIALGWALVLVIVARLGLDNAALRFATIYREESNYGALHGFMRFSIAAIVGASALIAIMALGAKWIGFEALAGVSVPMLLGILGLVFALAHLAWFSALIRTANRIFESQAYEQMLRPMLLIVGLGIVALLGRSLDATAAMALTFASALVALAGIAFQARRLFSRPLVALPDFTERPMWMSMSWMVFLMSLAQESMNQLEVILLGILADATAAAHFSAAARLASLVPFGLVAIVTISGPAIASAFRRNDAAELALIARLNSRFSFAFACVVGAILALVGPWALRGFGPSFDEAYPALLILLIGGLANAFTGSVGYYLSLTGHQRAALTILAGAALLSLALNIMLIPQLGTIGSAFASSVAMIFWNGAMLVYVRRMLGIDTSAIGLRPRSGRVQSG